MPRINWPAVYAFLAIYGGAMTIAGVVLHRIVTGA